MSIEVSDYRAPLWIPGGHLQTVLPALCFARPRVTYRREIWDTPDGDVIAVDFSEPALLSADAPVLVHFHGLEGSSHSHYAEALMSECASRGVRGMVVHYRGCGGIENRLPRAYFAGDACELDWIFKRVRFLWPAARIGAMGVSLGANNILYWAGTRSEEAAKLIDCAVAVCSPLDLVGSNDCICRGFSRIYERNFMQTLQAKARRIEERFPGLINPQKLVTIQSLKDFDEAVTAPLHGFKNALDYWTSCSSIRVLGGIRLPTLMINACNDPFVRPSFLPSAGDLSASVRAEFPTEGGHCGFPLGNFPGSLGYLPMRTLRFLLHGQ